MAAPKVVELQVCSEPHNGAKANRRIDPVDGLSVGGQYLYIRSAIRYKRFVGPLGRRWGKTTLRPFLWATEMMFTKGQYVAAFITSVHQKAWEAFSFSRDQLGGMVKEAKGEPESQNRYLDLYAPTSKEDPAVAYAWAWNDPVIGPSVRANWGKCTGARIYFLSGQYPMVQAVQGFPFAFSRISLDESQQQHPMVTRIVTPMLLDSGGGLDVSGIPDIDSVGNTWFSDYWDRTRDPKRAHRWAGINFPTYDNPYLNKEALAEVEDDLITQDDVDQYVWARFLSGSGSVFSNLDKVFTVEPQWKREHDSQKDLPSWVLDLLTRAPSDLLRCWIAEQDAPTGHSIAMSVDFAGRTRARDATVITVFDMTESRQIAVFSIRGMQSPDQLHWIEGVKNHYGCGEIYGDETPEGAALMG